MPPLRSAIPREPVEPSSDAYYHSLVDQSTAARQRGDHAQAQQFASAAHKRTIEEKVRRQRLAYAQAELQLARKLLESVWDKDRSCTTTGELGARYPEARRVIARCEAAEQQVTIFSSTEPQAIAPPDRALTRWRRIGNG